jgi:hypothetical protein
VRPPTIRNYSAVMLYILNLLRADEKHISRRLTTGAGSLGLDHGEVISK